MDVLGVYGYKDTHGTERAVVQNRIAISTYLKDQLNEAKLPCQIRTNHGHEKDDSMWGIEGDSSLKAGPGCCCELHFTTGSSFVNSLIRWYRDSIARAIRGLARVPFKALRRHRSRVHDRTKQLCGHSYSCCTRWSKLGALRDPIAQQEHFRLVRSSESAHAKAARQVRSLERVERRAQGAFSPQYC